MKVFLKLTAAFVVLFLIIAGGALFALSRGLKRMETLTIRTIHQEALTDGIYEGEYIDGRWSNRLRVIVNNQSITGIEVLKAVTFERPEVTQELIDRVISQQSTEVDMISGATVTCKAYLKSIEDALVRNGV